MAAPAHLPRDAGPPTPFTRLRHTPSNSATMIELLLLIGYLIFDLYCFA
jgi:hypothetical protein